jgi:hypothetical protein
MAYTIRHIGKQLIGNWKAIYDECRKHILSEIEVREYRPKKTSKQLANIFGNMINKVIVHCDDNGIDTSDLLEILFNSREMPSGVGINKDFIKAVLYAANPTLDDNDRPLTLSKMTKRQANDFFKRSADLLSAKLCPIPDPDPEWRTKC